LASRRRRRTDFSLSRFASRLIRDRLKSVLRWLPFSFLLPLFLNACAVQQTSPEPADAVPQLATSNLDVDDQTWQHAAATALGNREGAVLVIDPQTGRLRAVVNPRIAFSQAFPPGSTIKPFTALTALRAQLLDRETQRQCAGRYERGEYEILCSHPKSKAPFNLPQALAYSCNDYFGHVGERMGASMANATFASFGFGERTGVNAGGEQAGRLVQGEWRAQEALGDSASLLVTPIQLLAAYAALVNGGTLYRPQQAVAEGAGFAPQQHKKVKIAASARTVLLEGMRGAVKFGTADKAKLDQLPPYIFGKTGTSTASNGYQTQGWFAGFVAPPRGSGVPAPDEVKLGVLVFLKRGHGSEGAEVMRTMLDCVWRMADCGLKSVARASSQSDSGGSPSIRYPKMVRVKIRDPQSPIRHPQATIREVPFEAYVAGVVAAEGSVEERLEALKALAVASRTYALQNPGRHAREGFDYCSTTHCQQFWWPEKLRTPVRQAVEQTAGEVLQDAQGRLAESYFHAACGGQTANLEALWGVRAPAHLRGVRDDYCEQRPNRNWQTELPVAQLAAALHREPRTDAGAQLQRIEITQRDESGRAQTVALVGERRKTINGWDFKILVGRALGWQWVKSSWFEVQRKGDKFIFTGRGFGHGLGLCQEGAHVMAERGMNYRQILAYYFPGVTSAVGAVLRPARYEAKSETGVLPPQTKRSTLTSEHFRADYLASLPPREVELVLRTLEAARLDLWRRLAQASLHVPEPGPIAISVHDSTAAFIAATGQAGWVAAVTRGRRIELQPPALLQKQRILNTTLRHELAHVVIEALGQGSAPRWLAEGLAIHFAGEGSALERVEIKGQLALPELERRLARPAAAVATRELYARAYREVRTLIRAEGETAVWRRVGSRGN
jgi:stage II sporulation protein D